MPLVIKCKYDLSFVINILFWHLWSPKRYTSNVRSLHFCHCLWKISKKKQEFTHNLSEFYFPLKTLICFSFYYCSLSEPPSQFTLWGYPSHWLNTCKSQRKLVQSVRKPLITTDPYLRFGRNSDSRKSEDSLHRQDEKNGLSPCTKKGFMNNRLGIFLSLKDRW